MYKQKFLGMKKQVLFAMLLMAACCEKASPRNVTVDFPVSLNGKRGTFRRDNFRRQVRQRQRLKDGTLKENVKHPTGLWNSMRTHSIPSDTDWAIERVVPNHSQCFRERQKFGWRNGPPQPERKFVMGNLWKRLRTSGQKPI